MTRSFKPLEQRGYDIINLGNVGDGVPDIAVVYSSRGVWHTDWVEIKNGNAPYTPKEEKFMEKHPGLVITVRSVEDVERLF